MSEGADSVVIVGALKRLLDDKRIGGQAFACRSLADGLLKRGSAIIEVDSSIKAITATGGWARLIPAVKRMTKFLAVCVRHRPDAAVVFCSYGLSFLEKGAMVILARVFGVRTALLPRSGHLQRQLDSNLIFRAYARLVLRVASVVVCQSESWKLYFSGITKNGGNFHVIENWLPDGAFIAPCAELSGIRDGSIRVGYYSRIEENKGIFDFLESVRCAHSACPSIVGVIYGDGSCLADLQAWLHKNRASSYIEYRGWLGAEEKREALRELDIFLFASHAEGYPNALLEVMALKIPVVSVRVGAVPDMIEHDYTGKLVGIGDIKALAAAIIELADNAGLRSLLAERAYARTAKRNNYDGALDKMLELF